MALKKKSTKPRGTELNRQQINFCELVAAGMEVAEAYCTAYPNSTRESALASGYRLLSDSRVQKYLRHADLVACASIGLTTSKILLGLSEIAFSDIRDFLDVINGTIFLKDLSKLPPSLTRAIASVESVPTKFGPSIKLKLHPKFPALETLGKHTGMFSDINRAFTILRRYGFRVIETETGYRLLDESQEQPPDSMFEESQEEEQD